MKVSVILVNYNGARYNGACIDSVLACKGEFETEIYVVDNASTDESMNIIAEKYQGEETVKLEYLSQNYGFSYANNIGIKKAIEQKTDYVLLLNNDTEIQQDMIEQLLHCAQRHKGCVIAPKIYYSDNREIIWSAGGEMSPVIRKAKHIGLNQKDCGQFGEEKYIDFATGCCLLIPVSVIEEVGFLDEQYFLYYEDTEYCFRLQSREKKIIFCPDAIVYHKVGASSKGKTSALCAYYIARNWLYCNRQYLGKGYPVFLLYYAINRIVCCGLWALTGKGKLVRATWRGICDFTKNQMGKSKYY